MAEPKKPTARDLLTKADEHRRQESGADSAMRSIRLGYSPTVSERVRRRFRFQLKDRKFTAYETRVLYEALDLVREHHRTEAERYEAMVTTTEDSFR